MGNREKERIEYDSGGLADVPRYTHYPSGDTLVRQPHMSEAQWSEAMEDFFSNHPNAGRRAVMPDEIDD